MALAGIAFLLLFGVAASYAQTNDASSTPTGPVDVVDPDYDVSGYNLLPATEASDVLKDELYVLLAQDEAGMTELEEANRAVRISYYTYLAELIQRLNDVSAALPGSVSELIRIVDLFKSSIAPDPIAIYQETADLLKN